ncbi:glycine-rich domain-containing protein [Sinorhizobium fredii]|uniref:Uncharacterized protein n=1 Tax=Rhizobium fredii TaxID=380 RepID=A0A2A6LPS0_RHIFR|nr:hypothetical protein [Sinorhizobium fredii]PDT44358.1 hypothetical protein CO661_29660 [Sinorhizobium fredii]
MTPQAPAMDALGHEAPFLIEKLVKEQIVETPTEAEALFTEVKRYLVLAHADNTKKWQMYSRRIDECWHQFILFTSQYFEFCHRYFGRFLQHRPSNAPHSSPAELGQLTSFKEFSSRYEELFGVPLSDDWYDERNVTIRRRVLNERTGQLTLRDDDEMVELVASAGDLLFSVNKLARDALEFVAQTPAFYVRELPGQLEDDEKIFLVATLVEYKLLRLAP